MVLYFQDENGSLTKLADFSGLPEWQAGQTAIDMIRDFCKERGWDTHYLRLWTEEDRCMIDFGSHTRFFLLSPPPNNIMQFFQNPQKT